MTGERMARAVTPWPAALVVVLALGAGGPAAAQLSPGRLTTAHAELEGSAKCLRCHEPGKGVDAQRCLSCHQPLARRIATGRGLHASREFRPCETCHIEHQGRDFELVWWGEEGMEAFDHERTGWSLVGAHRRVDCRGCHRPEHQVDPEALRAAGTAPQSTFLGLSAETCLACHEDRHEGALGATCTNCHGMDAWKPAGGFDHDRTAFPLTGAHGSVTCAECHGPGPGTPGTPAARFAGRSPSQCAVCHDDAHAGRLGTDCASCHDVSGWRRVARDRFDHSRTDFVLRGAHAVLDCVACHGGGPMGRSGRRRQACTDCHEDPHGAVLEGGARACQSCHDESRFRPSSFGLGRHEETDFALEGAHLAVACVACHAPLAGGAIDLAVRPASCDGCHADPHGGTSAEVSIDGGCTTCHVVDRWAKVAFDHERTEFSLTGPHAEPPCVACHAATAPAEPAPRFDGAKTACASCHEDPHGGQFAEAGGTDCASCHQLPTWKLPAFDHAVRADYPLEGAHADLACVACHEGSTEAEHRVARYRGTPRECTSCHGGAQSPS